MEQHTDCSYCMCGTDNTLVDAFGIPMLDLPASKLILFKEQSHKGRVIVASKQHVDDISCMSEEDAAAFMADVRHVAAALHKAFSPDKINFGAYGDTMQYYRIPRPLMSCGEIVPARSLQQQKQAVFLGRGSFSYPGPQIGPLATKGAHLLR